MVYNLIYVQFKLKHIEYILPLMASVIDKL